MVYSLKQIVTLVEGGFRTLFGDREGRVSAEVLKIKDYRSRMYIDLVQVDES